MLFQEIGVDAQTGWPILLCPNQVIRYKMSVCPFCGKTDVISYHKQMYQHLPCDECGKFLQSFAQAQSRLKSREALDNFKKKLDVMLHRQEKGFVVPPRLREAVQLFEYLDETLPEPRVKRVQTHTVHCKYCGDEADTRVGEDRCIACADRYKEYRRLSTKIARLSDEDYQKLDSILTEYAVLLRKGRWAPDIPKTRRRMRSDM